MATTLVDSPPAFENGQAPPNGPSGSPTEPPSGAGTPLPQPVAERSCAKCGAAMLDGQDWCLQCGAGGPGSLETPGWRSTGAIVGAVAVLVLGAAAAGYAALSKGSPKPRTMTTTVARVAPPASTTTPATTATTPTTPGGAATTPAAKATLPLGAAKPPKIPLTAVTPKASEKSTTTTPTTEAKTTPTTTTPSTTTTGSGEGAAGEEQQQSAILLDTNAASTYDPYDYPASWFGDPSLTIDGDTSTKWTAQVNPETAPKLAEGLLIDLKAKHKVAVLELITSTPGMTVQIYGANGHTVPESITDSAWVPLSSPRAVKKKHTRFKLRDAKKAFTYITLWISKAPASSVGTATAPGHVSVNEVELFPPKG